MDCSARPPLGEEDSPIHSCSRLFCGYQDSLWDYAPFMGPLSPLRSLLPAPHPLQQPTGVVPYSRLVTPRRSRYIPLGSAIQYLGDPCTPKYWLRQKGIPTLTAVASSSIPLVPRYIGTQSTTSPEGNPSANPTTTPMLRSEPRRSSLFRATFYACDKREHGDMQKGAPPVTPSRGPEIS